MANSKPDVSVEYDGMGTCIEAYLTVDGHTVSTISANSPTSNDLTDVALKGALAALRKHLRGKTDTRKKVRPDVTASFVQDSDIVNVAAGGKTVCYVIMEPKRKKDAVSFIGGGIRHLTEAQ